MKWDHTNSTAGFHLIEILLTVALIGIVTAFCFPLYTQYTVQTHRLEAATTLSKMAVALEQFHMEHNSYREATLDALHIPEQSTQHTYRFSILMAADDDYQLTATPLGKQAEHDTRCGTLILNANMAKGAEGPGNVEECW